MKILFEISLVELAQSVIIEYLFCSSMMFNQQRDINKSLFKSSKTSNIAYNAIRKQVVLQWDISKFDV